MGDLLDSTYETKRDQWGNLVYFGNSTGFWWRKEFDERGNCLYHGDSSGFWVKHTYNENNESISYENYLGIKR